MKLAGWLSAAIEILEVIDNRHLPAKHALSDWGRSHRFAGSKDRAAIGNLVYDVLRCKASLAFLMQEESPRALTLAAAVHQWGECSESLTALFQTDKFAPEPLSEQERQQLSQPIAEGLKTAPLWVQANLPEWCEPKFKEQFADQLIEEGRAMARRAPLDLRVNTLKTNKDKLAKALQRYAATPTNLAPNALRIAPSTGAKKAPNIEAEAAHGKGWFEVQDEGSQIACQLTGVQPGDQVLDLCAGAGGKTLALSAMAENKGQIHAYDNDKQRLRPIFERLKRAGCRNVQTHEAGNETALSALEHSMDVVLVDAPCTGSGTWRRHPDAKWRLSEQALQQRKEEQAKVLSEAVKYLKPKGRLVYVTCSLLREENEHQISALLEKTPSLSALPFAKAWQHSGHGIELHSANGHETYLTLSPARHETDGFFIAILQNRA